MECPALCRLRAFLAAHRGLRIALIAACVLLVLLLVLHPHGTKTYLILGVDNYGLPDASGRSDVILLAQVDFTRTRITAVTFARDLFIDNERSRPTKINTIVRNHDEQTLCSLVEQNFGVPIDGWFRVNITSVILLVDAIGGAQVELTEAEAKYIDRTAGKYPGYRLKEGLCRLNGAQALCYARCRKLDNDMGRGERQSKLLAAMVKQTRSLSAGKLLGVFRELQGAWRSSLSGGEQLTLLLKSLWLRGAKVERAGMPFEGTWRYGNAGDQGGVIADLEENRRQLLALLGLPDSTQ